jgi:hypothetical protein
VPDSSEKVLSLRLLLTNAPKDPVVFKKKVNIHIQNDPKLSLISLNGRFEMLPVVRRQMICTPVKQYVRT